MKYTCTRDSGVCVSASKAILTGISPDGGLFLPESFPAFSREEISAMAKLGYAGRAAAVMGKFLTDFSAEELERYTCAAYAEDRFGKNTAPVIKLSDSSYILELFHGPTSAFKDFALQILPYLLTASARKNGVNEDIVILVATSGDTGKAALEGFADVDGTKICVFYPNGGTSPIQKLQMTTQKGGNVLVTAVDGNFDDAQTGVKAIFTDADYNQELLSSGLRLSSANSINWGRLVPQVAYYFSAYCDLVNSDAIALGDKINICVPTGNFGNILAGYYARCMGLPVGRLICASNRNNVLTDFFRTGEYSVRREFYKTTSPSMDILVSSNLERLLYEAADRDSETVAAWMKQLQQDGVYAIADEEKEWLASVFTAGCADDQAAAEEIGVRFMHNHYLMDTHTAVASRVLRQYREETGDATPTVIVSTANPYKFVADVLSAVTGKDESDLDAFEAAVKLESLSGVPVPAQVDALRTLPVLHKQQCTRDQMAEAVFEAFGG